MHKNLTALTVLTFTFALAGSQLALGATTRSSSPLRSPIGAAEPIRKAAKPATLAALGVKPTITGSINLTDQMWTCEGPVDLDSVTVTITTAAIGNRRDEDAVHLRPGCTGRIGQLNVTEWAGDAVKIAEGAHDLAVDGGTIRCLGKAPTMHQDGVQIMGGERIAFRNLTVDCGRANETLINANFFVKRAGQSVNPPSDIVCDHCAFGGYAAHTVTIGDSIRSGITNSTLCIGKYPRLTLRILPEADGPLNTGNTIDDC